MAVTATLIDTNVLFDYLSADEEWSDWSAAMISEAADRGPVLINPIIYAELSVRYERIEAIEEALPQEYFVRAPLPWDAAFLAAKCFASTGSAVARDRHRSLTASSERTRQSPG